MATLTQMLNRGSEMCFGGAKRIRKGEVIEAAVESFPQLSTAPVSHVLEAFLHDSFIRAPEINTQFILLSKYNVVNPGGVQNPELELLQNLDVDTFEALRRTGLLLINQFTGEYYLMYEFAGSVIDPEGLINFINKKRTKYSRTVDMVSRVNGLVEGVTSGNILDISAYLVEQGYIGKEEPNSIRNRVNSIYSYNLELFERALLPEGEEEQSLLLQNLRIYAVEIFNSYVFFPEEIASIVLGAIPNREDRINFCYSIYAGLSAAGKLRLLEVMEINGDFQWNASAFSDANKLEAIIPTKGKSEVVLDNVLERQVGKYIIAFVESNPQWLQYYIDLVNYISERLSDYMFQQQIVDHEHKAVLVRNELERIIARRFSFELRALEAEA